MEKGLHDALIRRRALLLSAAGALPLLGCGKSNTTPQAPVPEPTFPSTEACTPDDASAPALPAASAGDLSGPYVWTELVADNPNVNIPIPEMDGAALLSYNGYLWLIGGWNPSDHISPYRFEKNTTNAVWCSADGITWDNIKPDTYNTPNFDAQNDWEGRHTFGCVVFKGRMWIIGGDDQRDGSGVGSGPQKDIWSSADGVNWRKEGDLPFTKGGTPSTRTVAVAVVFKNEIFLLGGQKNNGSYERDVALNEIWKSADGKNWHQVGVTGVHWSPRFCTSTVAVFNNRLWVFGGGWIESYRINENEPTVELYNDVWSSEDGVNWVQHLPNDPTDTNRWSPRVWGGAAAFDGKLWVLTGVVINGVNSGDVWSSVDGVNWTRFPVDISPRHASGVVAHGNTLRVVSGHTGPNMHNDSWMLSPYAWERVEQNLTTHFGAIQGGQAAVSNLSDTDPKAWLLGAGNCIYTNAVWVTSDAGNWTLVKDNSYLKGVFDAKKDWAGRHMQSAVYFDNALWVLGGINKHTDYLDDVWRSVDGATWTRVATGVTCLKRFFHSVFVFQNKIWVLGGQSTFAGASSLTEKGLLTYFNDVWSSSDGITWDRARASAPWTARGQLGGALVFQGRVWVIAGGRHAAQGEPATAYNDVWSSSNGIDWTQHTAQVPWSPRRGHRLCAFDERMWVIGGWSDQLNGGQGANVRDIWYSSDGADWTQLPTPGNDVPGTDCAIAMLAGVPHIIGGPNSTDVWRLRRRDGKV